MLITASACAFSPERSLMFGFLSKLRISEDPYPTPLFERWTDWISPLKIGWTSASNVSVPIEDIPIFPSTVTEMSW